MQFGQLERSSLADDLWSICACATPISIDEQYGIVKGLKRLRPLPSSNPLSRQSHCEPANKPASKLGVTKSKDCVVDLPGGVQHRVDNRSHQ